MLSRTWLASLLLRRTARYPPSLAATTKCTSELEMYIPEVQKYIITFSKDLSATEAATIESQINTRGKFINRLSLINGAVVRWNMNEIDALKNMAGVATVEKDTEVTTKN
ncbi:hypothetical protein DFS34DRAFT_599989 [Phlyctochytrium arcticum]|nr:hypothetical protein DFS34DRAFT_599989 [Phlyctochytrium arcticum]